MLAYDTLRATRGIGTVYLDVQHRVTPTILNRFRQYLLGNLHETLRFSPLLAVSLLIASALLQIAVSDPTPQ